MINNYLKSDKFRKHKLIIRQFFGTEPKFTIDKKYKTKNYGGWELIEAVIKKNDTVYSIGICDDIVFDLEIIEKKDVNLFAFDPTPYSVDWVSKQNLPENFKFFPWAAAGSNGRFFLYPRISKNGTKSKVMYTFHTQESDRDDGVEVEALNIESMISKLGHKKIDVLKIDIEGAEYDFLDNLIKSDVRPSQLLVEFHHRFKGIGKNKTLKIVKLLRDSGYLIYHISITGREISFIHKTIIVA